MLHPRRPAPVSADRAPRCEGPRGAAGNRAGLALSWGRGFESGPSRQASGTATDRGHGEERGARGRHGGRRAHGRLFNVTSEMGSICPPGEMGGERRVLSRNRREGGGGVRNGGSGVVTRGNGRDGKGQKGLHFPLALEFSKAA